MKSWLAVGLAAAGFSTAAVRADVIQMDALVVGDGDIFPTTGNIAAALPPKLVINTGTLSIAPTGLLNLTHNALIVRTGNLAVIAGYVVSGYNGGTWTGYGIQSSDAAADLTGLTTVGILDNAEAHYSTWEGVALTGGAEILVAYTYCGDANLDGDVNGLDLALIGTGTGWYHGDFNYDGVVNAADVALFNASRQALNPEPLPEPGTLALLAVSAMCLVGRRRAE